MQCHRRLWLEVHHRDRATPIGPAQQGIFDQGTRVGEIARLRWPTGVLVEEDFRHHPEAVARTRALMEDPTVTAIFEAAFTELRTQVRVDILARTNDGNEWDLIEVKSSTSHKPEHDSDIAIQTLVLQEAGVKLHSSQLLVIDRTYVFDGTQSDPAELLYAVDVSSEVAGMQASVRDELQRQHDMVALKDEPGIEPDRHCSKPYDCAFWDNCTSGKPEYWIFQLPGIRQTQIERWRGQGLEDISELAKSTDLNVRHTNIAQSIQTGEPWTNDDLGNVMSELEYPVYYLDFETFNPAIPIYAGTIPYERVPFQWSCHIDDGSGNLSHREFLADGRSDPRSEFADTLLLALGQSGSIVVYSSFERSVLRDLAFEFEDIYDEMFEVIARLWDLLKVVRENYYHPKFYGSTSIKTVLPALAPDLDYSNLEISDGSSASFAFQKRAEGVISEAEWKVTSANLLKYCGLDTLAMVRVARALEEASGP
jgi:hypothetical protein